MTSRRVRIVQDGKRASALPLDGHAESLLENRELEAMLERGLQTIVTLTGARGGAIRLLSDDGRALRLASALGVTCGEVPENQSIAVDCGVCASALCADDMRLDRTAQACWAHIGPFAGDTRCGPVLAVPLHCRGKAIGVFSLFFGTRVPPDLAELLEPTAHMLDLVLENALLERERLQSSLVSERQLFASEVHDSLAQGLAYMRMRMSLLQDAIRAGERGHALKYFGDVNEAMGEAHVRLRELISHFRHPLTHGLLPSLRDMARNFEERTGVKLTIDDRAGGVPWTPDQEHQVFRIVQEALANVVKHAGAREARVVIERRGGQCSVSIEDDGCGVPRGRGHAAGHYGMDIMRERAQRLGGSLRVRSAPGMGTRVRLTVPDRPAPVESSP